MDDECFVCLEHEPRDDLHALGCACRGAGAWAHTHCCIQAAEGSAGRNDCKSWSECSRCEQVFTGKMRKALADRWWELVRARKEEDEERLNAASNLATCLADDGQIAEAEKMLRDVFAVRKRKQGDRHAATLTAANKLANHLYKQSKNIQARTLFREILQARQAV